MKETVADKYFKARDEFIRYNKGFKMNDNGFIIKHGKDFQYEKLEKLSAEESKLWELAIEDGKKKVEKNIIGKTNAEKYFIALEKSSNYLTKDVKFKNGEIIHGKDYSCKKYNELSHIRGKLWKLAIKDAKLRKNRK